MSTGWKENGGLFICSSKERMHEYQRLANLGEYFGIESSMLSPDETKKLYPLINETDMYGSLHSKTDGMMDPSNWVTALAKGAKMNGGKIFTNCAVSSINCIVENGVKHVSSVVTANGEEIQTSKVINCGGVWATSISAMVGTGVPLCAMKHAYVLTEKIEGISGMPNVRDHDDSVYFKVQGIYFLLTLYFMLDMYI